LQIIHRIYQWRNFENPSIFVKVRANDKVGRFFETQCSVSEYVWRVIADVDNNSSSKLWVDKVSNALVLQKVQENKSILDTVQHRKFRWIGHILRHDSLLRDIIEGRMKEKATRGRKWLQMLSDVISKSYKERGWRQKLVEEKGVINLPSKTENRNCGGIVVFDIIMLIITDFDICLIHTTLHCVSKKLCKLIFCQNFVKFRPILKIFGTKIPKRTSFSGVYSFSTSPNLCPRTTVLNADVPNC